MSALKRFLKRLLRLPKPADPRAVSETDSAERPPAATGTHGFSVYTIVAALEGASAHLPGARDWEHINEDQRHLLHELLPRCAPEVQAIAELESKAGTRAEVLGFLSANGFDNQRWAAAHESQGALCVAGLLDLLLNWSAPGWETTLTSAVSGDEYTGLRLAEVSIHRTDAHPDPVACIATASGDRVYVTACPRPPGGAFGLLKASQSIEKSLVQTPDFDGLVLPAVNWREQGPVTWLEGMLKHVDVGPPWYIALAFSGTKLRLDKTGMEVKTHTGIEMAPLASLHEVHRPPPLVIDRPFLLWISRGPREATPGLSLPLFVGYFAEDSWLRPAGSSGSAGAERP